MKIYFKRVLWKKSFFSMDLRPFKVVEVAQSTRIKELPLICLLWLADISRVSVCALTHSPLYCFLFHSSLSPNPLPPSKSSNIWPLFIYLDPYKSLYSIDDCNSTGNYLWGFEIFNTIFKIPLNGVYIVVILSLTNSNITLNLRLANAPENSRKLCKPETQSRIYVTF